MNLVHTFLTKLFRGIGTPLAQKHLAMLQADGIAPLLQVDAPNPRHYYDPHVYKWDVAVTDIVRKLDTGDRTRAEQRLRNAHDTFFACEEQCRQTNKRLFRFLFRDRIQTGSDKAVDEFITRWRKEIRRVLGRAPSLVGLGFSQGSTLSDKGCYTTIPDKMSSQPTAYSHSMDQLRDELLCYPILARKPVVQVTANRFFTVPKDSFKDRGCCVEASLNVQAQLAVAKFIRRALHRKCSIDIETAAPLHRELAALASIDESMATIDLSNASDTVAKRLVELILPDDWWLLLSSLRARRTEIDGYSVELQKFSSMGNGFTFELETLIFATLARTLQPGSYPYVFGDDIIVATQHADDLIAALRFFGFTPNEKKTFVEGPFRESCGGDYFRGVPVRAHYLKKIPDAPADWIKLANGLRRLDPTLSKVRAAWRFCIDQVPIVNRCFGPADLGDLVIHDPSARPVLRPVKAPDCDDRTLLPCWRIYRPVIGGFSLEKFHDPAAAIIAAAYGVGQRVSPRDTIRGYKNSWIVAWGLPKDDSHRSFSLQG